MSDNIDKAMYVAIGGLAGYLWRAMTSPIPVPYECPGGGMSQPITQGAASKLLQIGEYIDDVRPALAQLQSGRVPTPLEALSIVRQLRG